MLLLARRVGEIINIGDDVEVTVISITGNSVRLGITAPKTTRVDRAEIRQRKDLNADWKPPV
jgi:carbon storage regulator